MGFFKHIFKHIGATASAAASTGINKNGLLKHAISNSTPLSENDAVELSQLQNTISSLESSLANNQRQLSSLSSAKDNLQKSINDNKKDTAEAQTDLNNKQMQLKQLEEKIKKFEADNNKLIAQITASMVDLEKIVIIDEFTKKTIDLVLEQYKDINWDHQSVEQTVLSTLPFMEIVEKDVMNKITKNCTVKSFQEIVDFIKNSATYEDPQQQFFKEILISNFNKEVEYLIAHSAEEIDSEAEPELLGMLQEYVAHLK